MRVRIRAGGNLSLYMYVHFFRHPLPLRKYATGFMVDSGIKHFRVKNSRTLKICVYMGCSSASAIWMTFTRITYPGQRHVYIIGGAARARRCWYGRNAGKGVGI